MMTTFRRQRLLKDLSEAEKKTILDYLKKHKDDDDTFVNVIKKYNVSLTAVIALITNDELAKGVGPQ